MQGKFQMTIFKTAGHAIHEDEPEQFADTVLGFVSRHRIGQGSLEVLFHNFGCLILLIPQLSFALLLLCHSLWPTLNLDYLATFNQGAESEPAILD